MDANQLESVISALDASLDNKLSRSTNAFNTLISVIKATTLTVQSLNSELNQLNHSSVDSMASNIETSITGAIDTIATVVDTLDTLNTLASTQNATAGSTTLLSSAYRGLAVSLGLTTAALSTMLALVAGAVIVFKVMDALIVTEKEQLEINQGLRKSINETVAEQSNLNEELKTTQSRIAELQAMDSLSLTEQGELDTLQQENDELRNRNILLKEKNALEAQKLNKGIQKAYEKSFQSPSELVYETPGSGTGNTAYDLAAESSGNIYGNLEVAIYKTKEELFNERIKRAEELIALGKLEENEENELKKIQKQIIEDSQSLINQIEGYTAVTNDQKQWKAEREKMIADATFVTAPEQYKEERFNQVWNSVDFKGLQAELKQLAQEGALTTDLITSNKKYNYLLKETRNSADEVLKRITSLANATGETVFKPRSISDQISLLNNMDNKFSSINKLYAEFNENGTGKFSHSGLEGIVEAFKSVEGVNLDDFLSTLTSSSSTVEDVQNAFNDLSTQFLFASGCLEGLTESTAEYTSKELEAKGITNAHSIVMDYLAAAKLYAATTGKDLTNATSSEIVALLNEKSITDETKAVIAAYALQKVLANDVTLATDSDINNIKALMQACGKGITAITNFQRAKANLIASGNSYIDTVTSTDFKVNNPLARAVAEKKVKDSTEAYLRESEQLQAAVSDAITSISYGNTSNGNSPGGNVQNSSGSGNGSSGPSTTPQTKEFNWLDRSIKLIKDEGSQLESKASSSIFSYLGLTQEELDRAKEIMASTETLLAEDMQELMEIAKNAGMSLQGLFTFIENGGAAESKRSYLAQVLENDKTLLNQHAIAVAEYGSQYNKAVEGLSEEVRNKIEYGSDSIDTYSGDEAVQIQKAIDARDKYLEAKKDQFDAEQKCNKDIESFHQNNIDSLDQQSEKLKNANALIEAQIGYLKESGQIVTAYSYEQLIANNKKEIALIEQKIAEKRKELAELMNQEGFSEDSEEYAEKISAINDYEESIWSLQTAIQKTENELLNLPIENMDIIISMYESITGTIQRWGAEMEASGRKLSSDYYQSLINNGMKVIDQYKEQYGLVQDIMGEYQTGSDQWNKLYSKMQSINSAMSSMVENLYKWNEALLQMPLDSISEYSSSLQKVYSAMSDVQSDYDTVISAVTSAIEDEIDLLNKERDTITETYDTEINVIKERLDLINQQNDALQKQAAYEQALYDLQKANTQKTEKVIRDGEIVYETNADNLRSAQESVQDALFDLQTYELEKQLEDLETALDSVNDKYENQISALEKISEKWSEISDKVEKTKNEALTAEILGGGWKDKILSGNDEVLFQMFSGMYQTLSEQMNQYEEQIESTDNISVLLEDYVNAYKAGTITYDQAAAGINELLSQINQKMSAMDHLDQVFDFLSTTTGGEANAEGILTAIQSSLTQTGDELIKSFEQYNKNAGLISEYTTSWEQLTANVSDIKDILEDVRDNLEDALDNVSRGSDDDDYDDDKGVTSSNGGRAIGPGDVSESHYTGRMDGYDDDDYVNSGPGVQSYAQGIRSGLLGENNDAKRESLLKMISGQDLGDPSHAIPIIAHEGEAVLNRSQQDTLLSNFIAACNYVPDYPVPSYALLSASSSQEQINTFNFGGITIERCDSPDQLAEGILHGGLESAIRQSLGKYN